MSQTMTAHQKKEKALELAKRSSGVTDAELAAATGAKDKLPMASLLARLKRANLVTLSESLRNGSKVYNAAADAALPAPKPKSNRKPGRPRKTPEEKAASKAKRLAAKAAERAAAKAEKAAKKPAKQKSPKKPAKQKALKQVSSAGLSRRDREKPIVTAIKLADRKDGTTVDELAEARGATQVGPFTRTLRNGVKDGFLKLGGKRKGRDIYLATGKPVETKRARPGRPKGSTTKPKASPAPVNAVASTIAKTLHTGSKKAQTTAALLRALADLLES